MGLSDIIGSIFGNAPEYKAPRALINESDIDRLINATRSLGLRDIQAGMNEANRSAGEVLGARGMSGTGGIPAQIAGSIGQAGISQMANMDLGLLQQRTSLLQALQQYNQQNAMFGYQGELTGWQANRQMLSDLMDLGGSFAMLSSMPAPLPI